MASSWTGSCETSESQRPLRHSETSFQHPVPTKLLSETSEAASTDQDQPLSFDHTKLAVAAAAFRGPSVQGSSSQTQSLARVLQCGLPNLANASSRQTFSTQSRDTEIDVMLGSVIGLDNAVQDPESTCEAAQRNTGKSSSNGTTEERTVHVLGLGCYSSSDEECDT